MWKGNRTRSCPKRDLPLLPNRHGTCILHPAGQTMPSWTRMSFTQGGETSDIIQKGTSGLLLELQVPAHFLPHWEDPAQNLEAVPMHSVPELHADSTTWREIKNTRWICKPHVQSASTDSAMRKRCSGFIFLDLTEAYYRVLRPLVLGNTWTDELIAKMADRLGLGDDALHDLRRHLCDPHSLDRAGLPAHHQRYLRALHVDTFFYVDHQTDVCRTEIGSRPGDSFADVVFGYLWARLLKSLEEQLAEAGMLTSIPQVSHKGLTARLEQSNQPFLGPTWCDDLCVVCDAESPQGLISKVGYIASCLLDACESLAMTPNLRPGKTEIMFNFLGLGSQAAKRRFFASGEGGWLDVVCNYKCVRIHVTSEYQHLGGIIHHAGDQRKEARRRLAIGHQTFTTHRRWLLQNLQTGEASTAIQQLGAHAGYFWDGILGSTDAGGADWTTSFTHQTLSQSLEGPS